MPSTSSNYKLIIPKEVEDKIRYLQNKFPTLEWSGILFYTHTGSFGDELTITCKDIYPMDLGTSTYTEFFMSEDVTSYIAEHQDTLWECDLGLIHSHNQLPTFFSGTDTATLQSEGNDTNNFVSLIVNNEGTYSAAITRKVSVQSHTQESYSYKEWGNDEAVTSHNSAEENKTVIQYFMLNIEKEPTTSQFSDIDKRFEDIQKKKEAMSKKVTKYQQLSIPFRETKSKVQHLFEDSPFEEEKIFDEEAFDPQVVYNTVAKMLLCSFIVDTSKIDLDKWIEKNMVTLYDRTFGDATSTKFQEYVDFIVPFSIDFFDESISSYAVDDTLSAQIAYALKKELLNHQKDNNPYFDVFIKCLNDYTSLYE